MTQEIIDVGAAANDRTGDTWRNAFIKTNNNFTDLFGAEVQKQIIINELADFPTPVAGVITLLSDTLYLLGQDVSLGTDTIKLSSNTSLQGLDSIVISLTYTGTGDMFTIANTRNRIANLSIVCSTGRVLNYTDNTGSIFRMTDCTVAAARFGLMNGAAPGAVARFTNVSGAFSVSGLTFTGQWNTLVYEVAAITQNAGAFLDLGTATFTAIIVGPVLITVAGGAVFLSGLTNSGNIDIGGTGQVTQTLSTGPGTLLVGISVNDALWRFALNDDIQDTRSDALLSMQSNATNTVIASSGTYVLVAGTWVDSGKSQFSVTSAGRMTYLGGNDSRLPVDFSCSAAPVSGNAKTIGFQVALNGVLIPGSMRTGTTDAGKPVSITNIWQITMSTNDFVELFVANETDSIDILVSSAIGRVN